jgi:Protein of unknown function (DUF1761)
METFFTLHAIIIAAVCGYIFGALYYSPFLFLKPWLQSQGFSLSTIPKRSNRYIVQINVYSFIAHGCMAAVLALMFDLLGVDTTKAAVSVAAILGIGFVMSTKYIDMLYTLEGNHWDMKSQLKFLISAGYYVLMLIVMAVSLVLFH